ncbi:hypothetical protein EV421DRAFT_873943 [Armillaria borealis]|uniref:Uncharacterized protein n=1 Tax=Armillaria borealis TaxID=47425 RepID=A0AA39JBB8_9AGAR|nr:hypothetical protein EV421DRAFT_873943 [Armillaria borealis]
MLFLVETTCFVPPVAQCLHFGSCHRLERCYRPTVCPADRGRNCPAPAFCRFHTCHCLPSPFLVFYTFCLCVLSLFRFPCLVLLLQVCCIVMSVAIWGPCVVSRLSCLVSPTAGRESALISNFYALMKTGDEHILDSNITLKTFLRGSENHRPSFPLLK